MLWWRVFSFLDETSEVLKMFSLNNQTLNWFWLNYRGRTLKWVAQMPPLRSDCPRPVFQRWPLRPPAGRTLMTLSVRSKVSQTISLYSPNIWLWLWQCLVKLAWETWSVLDVSSTFTQTCSQSWLSLYTLHPRICGTRLFYQLQVLAIHRCPSM